MWKFVGATIVAAFPVAALEYVCGRIILPELGLTAPGYWPWFWVSLFTLAFVAVMAVIRAAVE
jgi:hypothetical protein